MSRRSWILLGTFSALWGASYLFHAIWHMLSRDQQFAPRGAAFRLAARPPLLDLRPRAKHPISPDPPAQLAIET
jgi:hypothetical protein